MHTFAYNGRQWRCHCCCHNMRATLQQSWRNGKRKLNAGSANKMFSTAKITNPLPPWQPCLICLYCKISIEAKIENKMRIYSTICMCTFYYNDKRLKHSVLTISIRSSHIPLWFQTDTNSSRCVSSDVARDVRSAQHGLWCPHGRGRSHNNERAHIAESGKSGDSVRSRTTCSLVWPPTRRACSCGTCPCPRQSCESNRPWASVHRSNTLPPAWDHISRPQLAR